METEIVPAWTKLLVDARGSTEFLASVRENLFAGPKKRTYASLTKEMGFASRSLLWSILHGKRAPSYKVFMRLSALLSLTMRERDHFRLLIAKDHPTFDRTVAREQIESMLARSRNRLCTKRRALGPADRRASLRHWAKVYAAVGERTSTAEVARLSCLSPKLAELALQELSGAGLVSRDGEAWTSEESHVVLDSKLHRSIVIQSILSDTADLGASILERWEDPEQLLFSGSWMVRRQNLPKLKQHLRRELAAAIERWFDPKGDVVVTCHSLLLK